MQTSDRDIIASVLAGERDRFHELVQRHSGPLWRTLHRALRNPDDASEVLQETWLRAFQRLSSLRDPSRARSWLLSIALNLVRQARRQAGLVGVEGDDALDLQPSPGAEEASDVVVRAEEADELRLRIAGLPARQGQVLDLRLNHELSHREVAELLDITPENSRANYYQALRRLRESDPREA